MSKLEMYIEAMCDADLMKRDRMLRILLNLWSAHEMNEFYHELKGE